MIAGTPLRPLRGAARRAGRAPLRRWRTRTRRDGTSPSSPSCSDAGAGAQTLRRARGRGCGSRPRASLSAWPLGCAIICLTPLLVQFVFVLFICLFCFVFPPSPRGSLFVTESSSPWKSGAASARRRPRT